MTAQEHDKIIDLIKREVILSIGCTEPMAVSLCVMMPVSAVSAARYAMGGALDASLIAKLIAPAVLGGIVGGILLDKLRENLIMKLFALLVIYSGLAMIVR